MTVLTPYVHRGITHWKPAETQETAPRALKMREYLGEELAAARKNKNLPLREVEAVSISYMSELERGKKEVSSEVLESICSSLDVKLSDLLRNVADRLEEVGK